MRRIRIELGSDRVICGSTHVNRFFPFIFMFLLIILEFKNSSKVRNFGLTVCDSNKIWLMFGSTRVFFGQVCVEPIQVGSGQIRVDLNLTRPVCQV